MARSHFIREKNSGLYWREYEGKDLPCAETREQADLYEQDKACAMATAFYGKDGYTNGLWEIIEATRAEHHSWLSRRGGRKTSKLKKRTSARNIKQYHRSKAA